MGQIDRNSLPQNFLDSVSAGTRLPTPQAQFFYAKMAMAGRLSFAAMNAGAPSVQQFVSMAGSGQKLSADLDELVRAADAYPGAVQAVDDFGKGMGDTIKFRRDKYNGGGFDQSSRLFNSSTTISTTGQSIQMEEVPLVLKQFIGPMASGATAPAPYAIPEFDAKYRASKEDLASAVSRYLQQDYISFLDGAIRDLTLASTNITYADDVTNVLSFTVGAGHVLSAETILKARKALSDREWKKFPNGRYMLLVPTKFNTDMIGDVDYREMSKVHEDGRNLLYGYVASIQDVDIFEVSTNKTWAASATVSGDGNAVPSSSTVYESVLLGPGALAFGTALAPECRWADDTNYGTMAKCIWLAMHAMDCIDTRGIQRILSQ